MSTVVDQRVETRGTWSNWSEYLFAFLGSLIGYGNVWRFPYVCFRNGGGAFLLPFIISIVVCGVPAMFLETLISQYSNYGPGRVWEVCPLFKGIGLSMMVSIFIISVYYTMIMAWTLFYLANSFTDPLPWSTCGNAWNTPNCTVGITALNASSSIGNGSALAYAIETTTAVPSSLLQSRVNSTVTAGSFPNVTTAVSDDDWRIPSTQEFWFNKALSMSSGIDDLGTMKWELTLCYFVAWLVTCLCLVKGIHSLGKVAYVAASLPYIILTCFLIRGLMLPGSGDGLYYFLVPRWELLAEFKVWRDAATQMFYSVGISLGTLSTLSSYSKFNNNCLKDAYIMPALDSVTSLYAGLVIFSYLGYTAHMTGKEMDDVVEQGPGLVFMAYPAALATLPLPQLWSVLFFLMLFTMGLDSQFVHVEALTTALLDCFPCLMSKKLRITIAICVVSFALGLPLTTQAGVYILNLLDWYIASVALLFVSACEIITLSWIYGTDRIYENVQQMIGCRPPVFFKYAWKYFCPAFIVFLWVSGIVRFQAISHEMEGFTPASDLVGVIIAIVPLMAIPGAALKEIFHRPGPLIKRLRGSLRPTERWRPAVYEEVQQESEKLTVISSNNNNAHQMEPMPA